MESGEKRALSTIAGGDVINDVLERIRNIYFHMPGKLTPGLSGWLAGRIN